MRDLAASLGDGLSEVVEIYLEDTPNVLGNMQAALDCGYWQELQRLAHSLKSSSGIFGAQTMVALCIELEHCAETRSPRCDEPLTAVAREFDRLNLALFAYLHK